MDEEERGLLYETQSKLKRAEETLAKIKKAYDHQSWLEQEHFSHRRFAHRVMEILKAYEEGNSNGV